jgi:hypothetical protein
LLLYESDERGLLVDLPDSGFLFNLLLLYWRGRSTLAFWSFLLAVDHRRLLDFRFVDFFFLLLLFLQLLLHLQLLLLLLFEEFVPEELRIETLLVLAVHQLSLVLLFGVLCCRLHLLRRRLKLGTALCC